MRTSLKMIAILILATVFSSCAVKTQPAIIPPAPPKVESVVPTFNKVDKGITDTLSENVKLGAKLKEQQKLVQDQKAGIEEAISQAEKIKVKAAANEQVSEVEAVNLINELHTVQSRNMFLETQNTDLTKIKDDQENILKTTKEQSEDALHKLFNKENEATSLRNLNGFLGEQLTTMNSSLAKVQQDLENEKVKAARAEVYRRWIIGLVAAFALWTVAKNVIMAYSPIKFRI